MTTLLGMRRAAVCAVRSMRTFSTSVIRRRIEENITGDRLAQLLQEQGTKPLLVDFVAEWCGPCKMLSPMLHKLASTPSLVGGKELDLVTIDVDQQMEAAQKYGVRFSQPPPPPTPSRLARLTYQIRAMPTVMAFKQGKLASSFVGVLPEPKLRQFIENL